MAHVILFHNKCGKIGMHILKTNYHPPKLGLKSLIEEKLIYREHGNIYYKTI